VRQRLSPRTHGPAAIGDQADVRATRAEGLRLQGYQVLTAAAHLSSRSGFNVDGRDDWRTEGFS
jgi:hypothetical protein